MKIIDPGHIYLLDSLDGSIQTATAHQHLVFCKREGGGYPGNVGHHPGTNLQETWRAGIDRLKYLNQQIPCVENEIAQAHLRHAIIELEIRAARRHNRDKPDFIREVELMPICPHCLHIGCPGATIR